jgi:hypothetical protein
MTIRQLCNYVYACGAANLDAGELEEYESELAAPLDPGQLQRERRFLMSIGA